MKRGRESQASLLDGCEDVEMSFSSSFGTRDMRLFEVPAELEKAVCEGGGELFLMGSENALDAVVCTGDRTYSIKKVETSNTVCLLDPRGTVQHSVEATCPFFYELKAAAPSFAALERALLQTVYRGVDMESMYPPNSEQLLTREQVEAMCLCSRQELHAGLASLGALEVDGKVRMVSRDTKWDLAKRLINEVVLGDLNYDAIDDSDLRARLSSSSEHIDYTLFAHTLAGLGELVDGRWALQRDKIASTAAHVIFREDTKKFHPKDSLLTSWELSLPKGVRADAKLLRGVALSVAQNPGEAEAFYTYLPVAEAGETVAARLKAVFGTKPKVSHAEIKPYLLLKEGEKEDDVLVEHTNIVDGFYISLCDLFAFKN